ncbi:MAG: hypothetical protein AAFU79_32515, partial [Myxococcota bacterium]
LRRAAAAERPASRPQLPEGGRLEAADPEAAPSGRHQLLSLDAKLLTNPSGILGDAEEGFEPRHEGSVGPTPKFYKGCREDRLEDLNLNENAVEDIGALRDWCGSRASAPNTT